MGVSMYWQRLAPGKVLPMMTYSTQLRPPAYLDFEIAVCIEHLRLSDRDWPEVRYI